jgi:hypothetical protein
MMGHPIAIGLAVAFLAAPFARADEHAVAGGPADNCPNALCLTVAAKLGGSWWLGGAGAESTLPPVSRPHQPEDGRALLPRGDLFPVIVSLSDIDKYLCRVYWRMPHKIDGAGDFSWKDAAAATRSLRTVCDYAISGMHPDLREILYAFGRAMDGAGISWSFLSGFRDDFRQGIASGFKASACGSLHGGSCRTKGWGDGKAADLWMSDHRGYPAEDATLLLDLVDYIGPSFGLVRPLPQADPAHVQVGGDWQIIGKRLHQKRVRNETTAATSMPRRCATSPIGAGC